MQSHISNSNNRGRPPGSKQKLPPGHVDIEGLADLLGLASASIPGVEARGDPRIPPRSPLAGFGPHRRAIWRRVDVIEHIEALAAQMPRRSPPQPQPMGAAWNQTDQLLAQPNQSSAPRRGRPRGTGKNSK